MSKTQQALADILACKLCGGKGYNYWGNGEDYDIENCICNPYGLIIDGEEVIYSELIDESLFTTSEAN